MDTTTLEFSTVVTDEDFVPYRKRPGLPERAYRRHMTDKLVAKRLSALKLTRDELLALWRDEGWKIAPGHLRKQRVAPATRRTYLKWDTDNAEIVGLALGKRGELGRPTRPGGWMHDIASQLEPEPQAHEDELMARIVALLIDEGWTRKEHA